MGSTVTIKDIARETGYSITTVSRVLSGSNYPVSADVRKAIEEHIASRLLVAKDKLLVWMEQNTDQIEDIS